MWTAAIDQLHSGRILRVRVLFDEVRVPFDRISQSWQSDGDFAEFFSETLARAPFEAFLWETPPVKKDSADRPFEFVLVDCPKLAGMTPDPAPFASYFDDTDPTGQVAVFPNLGGDALLVVPAPRDDLSAYTHLAAFARGASVEQQQEFWRAVGSAFADRLGSRPLWLSTNGLGVAWLHARLDTRPKYYTFDAYRRAD